MKQQLVTFLFFISPLLFFGQTDSSSNAIETPPVESTAEIKEPIPDSLKVVVADGLDSGKKKKEKKVKEPKPPKEEKIKEPKAPRVKIPPDTIARPTVGIGIGMLAFNGDIKSNENSNLFAGGLGTNIFITQKLSESFYFDLNFLLGNISSNERSLDRNLNFKSQLFTAGFGLKYNFNHFLNEKRIVSPYVSLGLEFIEFNSKTDLLDQYGNTYNYWSDGTIRNVPESSPLAEQSVLLTRDYVYETDIRSKNFDGEGIYAQNAWGIPISIGLDLKLTSKIDVGLNYTYHFSTTDDIDGINGNSSGERVGTRSPNDNNDKFWMLSAKISYNFTRSKSGEIEIEDKWSNEDALAFGTDDYDGDGVYDFMDECPQTPFGVPVDEHGCPLSKDKPPVLTDEQIYDRYLAYLDSTGLYAEIEKRFFTSLDKQKVQVKKRKRSYKVKLGEFVGGVPQEITNLLLGLPDVETHISGDTTIFTVGDFDNLPEAIQRKITAAIEGFDDAEIVMMDEHGKIRSLGDESGNIDISGADPDSHRKNPFVFRVQLGAFKKKKPDEAFKRVKNLVVVENEEGYTKYMSGAFENYVEAAKHKTEMVDDGWNGAFVVAYKRAQGNRVSMNEAGVTEEQVEQAKAAVSGIQLKEVYETSTPEKPQAPEFDKSRIKFKIQIGIYKNQVPPDVLSEYMKLNNLSEIEVDNSSAAKRYTSGEFKDYTSAVEYRNKLIEKGFETAFIIALKDGQLISIDEARRLLGEID